ncbi:hypothetical protein [Acanthopleuribacter pedis]|uniref:DUF4390 domain-containing protein n=1 Tax=Acanthopleuribacter pedis TaxID=442870 RepID=A0A8J7QQ96_9BACT|nr:hypothetical protein [Acanthopleuribacter pedis]MBO1322910.1 hypothetical protein [Acanthopleuribacter pedis]
MWLLVWFALTWAQNPAADAQPRLDPSRNELRLSLSGAFLDEEEVRGYLESGLTTSLLVRIQFRDKEGRLKKGAARVDLRYEPWDAVYFADVWDLNGKRTQEKLTDRDALHLWWRSLQLAVFRDPAGVACRQTRVSLEVLPFSAKEQNHARQWISEVGSGKIAERAGGSGDIELVNVLVATSMKRKPLMRFAWRIPCEDGL